METVGDALELLEKSIESKEIDVFLIGVANLQEGTTRVSYKHGDDLVGDSGGHLLNLIVHIMRIIAELNDLDKKELYNALIDLLDNDLIEH
jgi:hypothetical protein